METTRSRHGGARQVVLARIRSADANTGCACDVAYTTSVAVGVDLGISAVGEVGVVGARVGGSAGTSACCGVLANATNAGVGLVVGAMGAVACHSELVERGLNGNLVHIQNHEGDQGDLPTTCRCKGEEYQRSQLMHHVPVRTTSR